MYHVKPHFVHPITAIVSSLASGFNPLARQPEAGGLDYIRGNLLQPGLMTPLPHELPGPDNDLNEKLDQIVQRAMADPEASVYAFGERWGPEDKADKYFGFIPGNGVHDVHMNQGNVGQFVQDDGVWQDGGLLFHFPAQGQWTAVFLKFHSQSWHTDDRTGHTLTVPDILPDGVVRIVAAMVNAKGSPEKEWVFLLNTSDRAVPLTGWELVDKQKARLRLHGSLDGGAIPQGRHQAPGHPLQQGRNHHLAERSGAQGAWRVLHARAGQSTGVDHRLLRRKADRGPTPMSDRARV